MRTIRSRILELAQLKQGWLDGHEGEPLPRSGLTWLEEQLTRACVAGMPMPWIYATADGNVQLEWRFGTWSPSLEINTLHRLGQFHTCDVASTDGDHDERSFDDIDLHEPEGWELVAEELEQDRKAAGL